MLNERMIQIERYYKFRSITEAAESIEKIRKALQLKNPFKELHILLNVKTEQFTDWTILRMDDEVERTIQILKKMDSPQKLECLTSFVKSMDFVKWLRSNTKNLKEMKFFVDLASIGEKSTSTDLLAKILKEAGTAFAPLIFDLNVNTNFTEFMKQCDTVWSHLDTDKNICEKLLYFEKDKIEILENIRQQSGNVEMSSINKAKQFNGLVGDKRILYNCRGMLRKFEKQPTSQKNSKEAEPRNTRCVGRACTSGGALRMKQFCRNT